MAVGKTGDLWRLADADDQSFVVVPTNCCIKQDGTAVMGAGVAKDAAKRFPELPRLLGNALKMEECGPQIHEFLELGVICLPTKNDWRDPSDLTLIRSGLRQLAEHSALFEQNYYMPMLGCGLGGLDWKTDVRPIIVAELPSDNFIVVRRWK